MIKSLIYLFFSTKNPFYKKKKKKKQVEDGLKNTVLNATCSLHHIHAKSGSKI